MVIYLFIYLSAVVLLWCNATLGLCSIKETHIDSNKKKALRSQNSATEALKRFDRVFVCSLWECGFLHVCQLARREDGHLTFPHYLFVFIDRLQMNCKCVNLQGAESSRFRDHGEAGLPRDLCTSRLQHRPRSMLLQSRRMRGERGTVRGSERRMTHRRGGGGGGGKEME